MKVYNPVTSDRILEFKNQVKGKCGTVGAVALDKNGYIFAGTSTGGIGGEIPGRVSDCPTVAGTFASKKAGVSCTGIGEHITHQATAAKIVTRVDDGMTLSKAVATTIDESNVFNYSYGLISLDSNGKIEIAKTYRTSKVFYVFHDEDRINTFLD